MKIFSFIQRRLFVLGIVVMIFLPQWTEDAYGQVTRSQVNLQFMRAEMFMRKDKVDDALAALDVVIELSPGYPAPYLRKAHIFEDVYERKHDPEALASAIYFYRKFLTLEFDSEKIVEPRKRLRQLEDLLKINHFEDLEEQDSKMELTRQDAAPVVTTDEEAKAAVKTFPIQKKTEEAPIKPYEGFSFLRRYRMEMPQINLTPMKPASAGFDLTGLWVSDNCIEDGREMWIFQFKRSNNGTYLITISDQSGIVSESRERRAIQKQTMSYMRRVRLLNDMRYVIVNEEAEGKVNGNSINFVFAIDEEYDQGKNIYKWTRNMISNIAHLLPFIDSPSNTEQDNAQAKELASLERSITTTVEYTFDCKLVSPNVLECDLGNVRNSVNANGYMRTRRGQNQKIYLHRASDDYTKYDMPDQVDQRNNYEAQYLFMEVSDDAQRYMSRNYPLAILYQYGIGVKQNEGKAIQLMTQLATMGSEPAAKAWLANYYFHEAYEEEEHSTATRRKYLKSSNYWMQSLHDQNDALWYGLKGDMYVRTNSMGWDEDGDLCSSLTPAMVDSAANYYRQGAHRGDLRSIQQLGHLLLWCTPSKRNLDEASMWLNQAVDAGNAEAELDLGRYYLLKNDYRAYIEHTTRSAEMGCPMAFEELSRAYCYSKGKHHGLDYDFEKSIQCKQLAARAEDDAWIPILLSYGYKISEK